MIAVATGHRWTRLDIPRSAASEARLEHIARSFLLQLQPDAAVSGLALCWDVAFARAALGLGIPLLAYNPGRVGEQTSRLDPADKHEHAAIERAAAEVHYIGGEGYHYGRSCVLRDKAMVERGHVVAALWSGIASGTGTTIRYAERRGLPVVNLWALRF